ncbi:MAG: endolytic transglycosylase MltG [Dongiaceae bacterium]
MTLSIDSPPPPKKRMAHFIIIGIGLAALAVGFGLGVLNRCHQPNEMAAGKNVIIAKGSGLKAIAGILRDQNFIADGFAFKVCAYAYGENNHLQAGEFSIPPFASIKNILDILGSGKQVARSLTIIEGHSSHEIINQLNAMADLSGPPLENVKEGTLLPETYHYHYGDNRADLLKRMQEAQNKLLAELWPKRRADLNLANPEQAVILASIVEKETSVASERPKVARVYLNRLNKGMLLQADPTVAYGLGLDDRLLTRADLAKDNPYNTYRNPGLPPGPIANPGRASIEAVFNPADGDELYFVADGTGGHVFAKTLKEHEKNVRHWRKISKGK